MAGDNFRDCGMLCQIIGRFAQRFPDIGFDLVGMQYAKLGTTTHLPSVTCQPRSTQVEYARVITEASFMLLPLEFVTANNALLEALVMVVPVLCNRIEGVTDYLPDETYLFDDLEQLCSMVEVRQAMSPAQRAAESTALIAYVQRQLSWPVVREKIAFLCPNEGGSR